MTSFEGWTLIETLSGEARLSTVVAQDGHPKDWNAVSRSMPTKAIADAVHRLVFTSMRTSARSSHTIGPARRSAPVHIDCQPVMGPALVPGNVDEVYAVYVWCGPIGVTVPSRPFAAANRWSSIDREFRFGPEMADAFAWQGERLATPGHDAFARMEHDDHTLELIEKLRTNNPGDRWAGHMLTNGPDGPWLTFQALRAMPEPDEHLWRGVIFDVVDESVRSTVPVELFALRHLAGRTGDHIALVDARTVQLVRWLTEAVPDIAWKGAVDSRDTPHPEDVLRIAANLDGLRNGDRKASLTGVRLRRLSGGWTLVDAEALLLPKSFGAWLLLVQFRVTGYSDEPDPVPVADPGYLASRPRA